MNPPRWIWWLIALFLLVAIFTLAGGSFALRIGD